MRRSSLLVAAVVLASCLGVAGAIAALHEPAARTDLVDNAERQPASQPDLESSLAYLEKCDTTGLSRAGTRAYRQLERLVGDGLTLAETDAAFDARGVLMGELSCWPDGYPKIDLGNDYGHPA